MKLATVLFGGALAVGCASSSPRPAAPPVPQTITTLERDRAIAKLPAEAHRLLAAHDQLVTSDATSEHAHVIHALDRLADALEVIAPGRPDDIFRVRQSARELHASPPDATEHAELVRSALDAAARALHAAWARDDKPTSIHALRLQTAALAVENAAAEVDADTPLLDQYEYVRVAIRESTRGVFAALGAPEPEVAVHTARR